MDAPSQDLRQAYQAYDREVTLNNFKVACVLGMILMPAGFFLDCFVYEKLVADFLKLRILSSVLIGVFLGVMLTPFGRTHYRILGLILLAIPASFISLFIYLSPDGVESPYYAGLNLVLLMLGFVLRWTFRESLLAALLTIALYLTAAFSRPLPMIEDPLTGRLHPDISILFNNLYFLVLTGIIVVTGNYFLSALRFREFALRYQLDRSKQEVLESNKKLLELDRVKSQFFANISHELRTPLTLLLAPLENLLHRRDADADPESRALLGTMHANGMRLLRLINDLLDLVRLESGRMEIKREPLNLTDILGGLASAARQVAAQKHLELETVFGPGVGTAWADPDKLERIILNLLMNAIKFTPAGGRVELRAQRHERQLILEVEDTGIGIVPQQLPFIFDRFWQADGSSSRRYGGAGIGLALVKELTEIQGGQVQVASQPGKGTRFTVQLPYLEAPTQPPPEPRPAGLVALETPASTTEVEGSTRWLAGLYRRADLARTRVPKAAPPAAPVKQAPVNAPAVLIADDEIDMLRFLASQLAGEYRVIEASNGQEAINRAAACEPDVILLDMMMPEKDGLEACREIRRLPSGRNVPIVLITAFADEETKLASLAAGASDFLAKPFSTTELQVRLRNLVEAHRLQKEISARNQALETALRELKNTQTQLVQSEKMASLGRLSAGIIHEINNPLNFATTGFFELRSRLKSLPKSQQAVAADILNDIEDGMRRVQHIVTDLRSFSFPSTGQQEEVPVAPAVDVALRMMRPQLKEPIQVECRIPDDLVVLANRNKFIQICINLIQNAVDALKHKTLAGDPPLLQIYAHTENQHATIHFRDNGHGIAPEHLDKIFDPFFTTKDVGQGMGLGLSICYRLVQEAGGRITAQSDPGQYAEFTVELPLPPAGAGDPGPGSLAGSQESLPLADIRADSQPATVRAALDPHSISTS